MLKELHSAKIEVFNQSSLNNGVLGKKRYVIFPLSCKNSFSAIIALKIVQNIGHNKATFVGFSQRHLGL